MNTVLVTGATDGIGLETARQLLALGWRVLVHGRNPQRAEGAAQTLTRARPGASGRRRSTSRSSGWLCSRS